MNDFNEAAKAVETILRKNGLTHSDVRAEFLKGCVTTGDKAGKTAIEITWMNSGREEGHILYIGNEDAAHKALALLRGQTAEPIQKFGEKLSSYHGTQERYEPTVSF